ncbi:MAG: hypothetical protein AB7G18_11785 [Pyrinomonadaceae bacterium]
MGSNLAAAQSLFRSGICNGQRAEAGPLIGSIHGWRPRGKPRPNACKTLERLKKLGAHVQYTEPANADQYARDPANGNAEMIGWLLGRRQA